MPWSASSGSASRTRLAEDRAVPTSPRYGSFGELVGVVRSRRIAMATGACLKMSASRARAPPALARISRAHDLRVDPREQLARAERLDEIVVGAGLQAFDARLLAGARREQDHRERSSVAASARSACSSPKPSSRGIITSARTRSGASRRAAVERRRAVARRPRLVASASSRCDVVAHVGVVVGEQTMRAVATGGPLATGPCRAVARCPLSGSQRSASSTYGRRTGAVAALRARRRAIRSAAQVADARRDRHRERRARARPRSRPRRAAMQPDQLLHQRQPDAGAFVRAARAVPSTRWKRSNTCGRSRCRECRRRCRARASSTRRPHARRRHGDPPVERELERVREQVEDDLLPHLAVDVDRLRERRAVDDERRGPRARSPTGTRSRGRR